MDKFEERVAYLLEIAAEKKKAMGGGFIAEFALDVMDGEWGAAVGGHGSVSLGEWSGDWYVYGKVSPDDALNDLIEEVKAFDVEAYLEDIRQRDARWETLNPHDIYCSHSA